MKFTQKIQRVSGDFKAVIFASICTFVLTFCLHYSVLHKDIIGFHSWRQSWTQTNIRNFTFEDFNILNPRINNMNFVGDERLFRNEFPLYQWIVGGFNKLTHYSVFHSRMINLIASFLGMIGMGIIAQQLLPRKASFLTGLWCLCWSPVFFFYSVNVLPDVFAFCFVVFSIGLLLLFIETKNELLWIFACLFFGLSALQKLPYIIFIPSFVIAIFFSTNKIRLLLFLLASMIPAACWYSWVMPTWENGVTKGILNTSSYNMNDLINYFKFYTLNAFPNLFIVKFMLPFLFVGAVGFFSGKFYSKKKHLVFLSAFPAVSAYFIFELNMLSYSHDYYLLGFLPFFIYFILLGFWWLYDRVKWFALLPLLILPFTTYQNQIHQWDTANAGFDYDIAKYSKEIQNVLPEKAVCITGNDVSGHIYLYYLNRKGFTFTQNCLDTLWTKDFINRGANYFIADNTYVETNEMVTPFLDKLILIRGNIRVFKLRKLPY